MHDFQMLIWFLSPSATNFRKLFNLEINLYLYTAVVFSLKTCFVFFNEHCFFLTYCRYCCSFRTHQQKEPNTACVSYCSMRQSPETAFYFLSVYLVDKSKHSSNNQKVMASFLRVNKVLQVNLRKEQQILIFLNKSIVFMQTNQVPNFSCFNPVSKFLGDEKKRNALFSCLCHLVSTGIIKKKKTEQ